MKAKQALFAMGGSLLLGAIGSGIWERLLGPMLLMLYRSALNLGGSAAARYLDGIYKQVGVQGRTAEQLASLELCLMLMTTAIVVASVAVVGSLMVLSARTEARPSLLSTLARFGGRISVRTLGYVDLALLGIVLAILNIQVAQAKFMTNAAEHFARCSTILRAVEGEASIRGFEARFAQLKGKADYLALMKDVQSDADSAKVRLPHFDAW